MHNKKITCPCVKKGVKTTANMICKVISKFEGEANEIYHQKGKKCFAGAFGRGKRENPVCHHSANNNLV